MKWPAPKHEFWQQWVILKIISHRKTCLFKRSQYVDTRVKKVLKFKVVSDCTTPLMRTWDKVCPEYTHAIQLL